MKEKRSSVEVRQRIAQWEGWGGHHHTKGITQPPTDPHRQEASSSDTGHTDSDSDCGGHPVNMLSSSSSSQCLGRQATTSLPLTPTSPLSTSSSLQENGGSELDDPLLRETSSLRLSTPVRNSAVRRFWEQQVGTQSSCGVVDSSDFTLALVDTLPFDYNSDRTVKVTLGTVPSPHHTVLVMSLSISVCQFVYIPINIIFLYIYVAIYLW